MTYTMSDKKAQKLEKVKKFFDDKGFFFDEKPNGQLVFDSRLNLWATTEKWNDTTTGETGVGINTFYTHLKSLHN